MGPGLDRRVEGYIFQFDQKKYPEWVNIELFVVFWLA
jgi:hypothetical protein